MSFPQIHFQPISCQYPSRKHTTSDHTEWVQVKKQFTHFTDSQQDLEPGNAKDEHEQTAKPFTKLATKTPWAATWNPGTQQACAPSTKMWLRARLMRVTEVFVFKASASAWPKGKRLGSRSRLTSVRPHEIQMRHNSQFPTPSFQRTNSTGSRNQGKCRLLRYISSQYHANIPVESIPHQTTQNEFKSKSNSPTSLTVNKIWNLEMRRMSMSRLQNLSPNWRQRHHEQPLGIPGHNRPVRPQRRCDCEPG